MFFKKLKESPLYYWEEKSYVMAITDGKDDDNLLKNALSRIDKSKEIKVIESNPDFSTQTIMFKVECMLGE